MKLRYVLLAGLAFAGLTLVTASATGTASTASRAAEDRGVETYDIDGGHSSVVFKVKHLDVTWFYGRFNEIEGTYSIDHGDPTKSSVQLTIPTASIDTNSTSRDLEMKSAGFFDAEAHPELTFESKQVEVVDETHWKVTGELGCKGKTHEVVVDLHYTGETDHPRFGFRTGFEGTFEIDRVAFDIGAGMPESLLSQKVYVTIGLEGTRR